MELDANPSIIFGLYTKPKRYEKLIEELDKLGVGVREIKFIDVEIPLERKDEVINFFKHFINCNFWTMPKDISRPPRNLLLHKNILFNKAKRMIEKKTGYKPITFNYGDWKCDNAHPLLLSLMCPLFIQNKLEFCKTEKEKQAMKDLFTFKSKGYNSVDLK